MKQIFTLSLFLFFSTYFLHAQTSIVSGSVSGPDQKPAEFATVLLKNSSDSTLAKGATTDETGHFEMEGLSGGNYFVEISFLGTAPYASPAFALAEGQKYALPAVKLAAAGKELGEVTIEARKPMIEVKADKTVFNVENTINATGSNGLELLRKSPGVTVDNNDNISLKGSQGVRVTIDGKPSPFDGKDLAAFLRTIPSSQIASIEIVSNPSAKFDAAGTAGVINIKLKKNPNLGTNGTLSLGGSWGITPKFNGSVSLNHRNNKIGLFGTYSANIGDNENWMFLYREQNGYAYDQRNYFTNSDRTHNYKAGIDLFLNSKHTLGFMTTGNVGTNGWSSTASTPITEIATGISTQVLDATNNAPNNKTNLTFNLNYRFADTTGQEFSTDADYGIYRNKANSYQPNTYRAPTGELLYEAIFKNNTRVDIDMAIWKADYSRPLLGGKMEAGLKSTYIKTRNTFDFYNVVNGVDEFDLTRSNDFEYTENVNAAYLSYNRQIKKWGFQVGLRVEQTNSIGDLKSITPQPEDYVKRNYLDFFPSASISFAANQTNQFSLSYSRRIDRPNYQDLNPFENRLDELSYQKGNAFLRPQYTHSVELSHTFMYMFTTSLSYRRTSDYFTEITDTTEQTRNFITTLNLANQDGLNLNISAPLMFTKWWTGFVNLGGSYVHNRADFGGGKVIDLDVWSFNVWAQQTFKLPANFTIEISGMYSSPSIWGGTFANKRFWGMDAGVQKTFFQDRATLKVSLTDIFHSMTWRGISDFGGLYMDARGGWESRQVRLDFTWRFGSNSIKVRDRKLGSEAESKRIK